MNFEDKITGVWVALFVPWATLFMWDTNIINNPFFIGYTVVFLVASYVIFMLVGFGS